MVRGLNGAKCLASTVNSTYKAESKLNYSSIDANIDPHKIYQYVRNACTAEVLLEV